MQTVPDPDTLVTVLCPSCKNLLAWAAGPTSKYPCDAVAYANCCGRDYTAYPTSISISSCAENGN